jgi:ribosomal-protein-serine acetyltransferase
LDEMPKALRSSITLRYAQVGGARGPHATSPPRSPRDLSSDLPRLEASRAYPIGGMFQLLVDDEVVLVLAEERHAQAMTDLISRNQKRLARWEPWAEQPATVDGTRAYIRAALEDFLRGSQVSTIIALDGGRRFIGRCGMRINPHSSSGDVGYWIDAEYEGRGITRRATQALVSSAFNELGLKRVDLRTSVENMRSRALAEHLGFSFEGIHARGLRFASRTDDLALYTVSAEQWAATQR